eukprot:scaffold2765_cov165-Amphora_coffeaeformis.AAC.17
MVHMLVKWWQQTSDSKKTKALVASIQRRNATIGFPALRSRQVPRGTIDTLGDGVFSSHQIQSAVGQICRQPNQKLANSWAFTALKGGQHGKMVQSLIIRHQYLVSTKKPMQHPHRTIKDGAQDCHFGMKDDGRSCCCA